MSAVMGSRVHVEAKKQIEVANFDMLRLVFAGMVVVFHAALLSQAPAIKWMLGISSTFAVQAFFFVSGFLVTMSCERSSTLKSYFKKRFLRIAPAYITVIFLSALLMGLVSDLSMRAYYSDVGVFRYLFYNLILSNFSALDLPGVFSSNSEATINGSLWTIKIEVAYYCLVPLLIYFGRRFDKTRILAAVFVLSICWRLGFTFFADHLNSDLLYRLAKQLPGQLAFFVGGAWAYYRTLNGKSPPPLWQAVLAVAAYCFADGLVYWLIAPVAVTIIVYWLAIGAPRLWSTSKYGDFSYGLYLYHFPLVQIFIHFGFFDSHPYLSVLVVFALALGAAILSWFFIESRFLGRRVTS